MCCIDTRLYGPFKIVHNAVDSSFSRGDPSLFSEKVGIEDYVLFVGRIELIKNVHGLIKAFDSSELDTNLVILGRKKDASYYQRCKSMANDS